MINEFASKLKLSYTRDNFQQLIDEANHVKMSYDQFLLRLLEGEWQRRTENAVARRLKEAKFPLRKYLVDFDRTKYDAAFLPKFEELETLEFIDNKENIILIGTPGAGKTHYAIALGISACLAGKNVLFASVPNLIVEMKEAMSQQQISRFRRRFEKYVGKNRRQNAGEENFCKIFLRLHYHLVILDELGYVSFDKASCEMLFNLLSIRNDKGSIIITTNLNFDRWQMAVDFCKTRKILRPCTFG